MADKVTLIKNDRGELAGFRANGKEFYGESYGYDKFLEIDPRNWKGFNLSSIPDGFYLKPIEDCTIVLDGAICSDKKHAGIAYIHHMWLKQEWTHKFGIQQFYSAMKKAIEIRKETNKDVEFDKIKEDYLSLEFTYRIFALEDMPIDKAYQRFKNIAEEIEGHTNRILEGTEIQGDILDDESMFTTELLLPLFRNMGFIDVKYNHGKREFGKDITFSEMSKFGFKRNYGVQVKAGDLSGEAGAEIDQIIAQIEDALTMSYIDTTSREKRHISDLIIAISGRFTDNAKDKIIEKVNRRALYFLDIDKIQELLTQYMKKMVRTSK